MVYRIYVEKREELALEARGLLKELRELLGLYHLTGLRLLCRYDVEDIDPALMRDCRDKVFAEPQLDVVYDALPEGAYHAFAVEYLPGQYDQRADSAAQCIQILSLGERPRVRTAKVYLLTGQISSEQLAAVKRYVINPVESREAGLGLPETLALACDVPGAIPRLEGFTGLDEAGLEELLAEYALAMDLDDLRFTQAYFRKEGREPTLTELRVLDTYWSDHCRHTTFLTHITDVAIDDPLLARAYEEYRRVRRELGRDDRPVTLMDIGTLAAKYLRARGGLARLDESEEINACTVKIDVDVDGETQKWLLLFKNETHNHPTEIEPFGGAATCIGGAIRDPLSGRAYVYSAMRLTGGGDPLTPLEETLPGKLPQRSIATGAWAGYSSYGNQIGLATGLVDELYHPGYVAKRMEIGAVVAAAPEANVRREVPAPGDAVILLGGRTGRDGCGGATGSSKSHTAASLETCGAEVQKGNAPEERKLQRLFRNAEAALLVKRCNDFGAGGVSVAIGELAEGVAVDLDAVPRKYEGLDGTELAISESQERMAAVVAARDVERFLQLASEENLEATVVARVTVEPYLRMTWRGERIVELSRAFLDTNGAPKTCAVAPEAPGGYGRKPEAPREYGRKPEAPREYERPEAGEGFAASYRALAGDLNACSRRGMGERFDATIGAGTVLMPYGGKYQRTPIQAMAHKIPLEKGETSTCSLMSWGYNPYIAEASPYHGGYLAVVEGLAKLIATGAGEKEIYLTFQEYFEKPGRDAKRWGKPFAALLGAFQAQLDFGVAAIGGKDSMSGSFEQLDVPPTLVSFAVTTQRAECIVSPEFKGPGHKVILLLPEYDEHGLPVAESQKAVFAQVRKLLAEGDAVSAWACGYGGPAEAVMKMCLGNRVGFAFHPDKALAELFSYAYGGFVLELARDVAEGIPLGTTTEAFELRLGDETVSLEELLALYEGKLEPVYPLNAAGQGGSAPVFSYEGGRKAIYRHRKIRPRILIPAFAGTNCEVDTAKALLNAGAEPCIMVVRNRSAADIQEAVDAFAREVRKSQAIIIPGGFSAGDEPDGSGKFITAFFRSRKVCNAVTELLERRDGLIAGICNGFQALIKLGLVPYGRILAPEEDSPTLTYNRIGRHQSKIVRTRVCSNLSPWLANTSVGEVYEVPVSHGEGRFLCSDALAAELAAAGQIATQYVDFEGRPTMDVQHNPNGSACAVEGITSPDGRVLGKMGHSERTGPQLYKNAPGRYDMKLFEAAVAYFIG